MFPDGVQIQYICQGFLGGTQNLGDPGPEREDLSRKFFFLRGFLPGAEPQMVESGLQLQPPVIFPITDPS